MPTASSNGISIYYEIRGDGRPLIFIPGLGTDITEYRPILTWLEARFRVLAVDNRGAGRSDKPDQPYTIEQMAEDTAAVARAVELGPAAVLGISMGGRIALALTVAHPELVSRLVLVSTSARGRRTRRVGLLSLFRALPRLHGAYPQPRYA